MKAIILAAGLGTRLKPLTDTLPKALIPIGGIPMLQHTILRLKSYGFNDIAINVHYLSAKILTFLKENNNFGVDITIFDESEHLLDTGGAIKNMIKWCSEPFIVHNVDILSNVNLKQLFENHILSKGRIATLLVNKRETYRHLLFDENSKLKGWINEKSGELLPPDLSNLDGLQKFAFSGIQVISPSVFELMKTEKDKFRIIDFYLKYCKSNDFSAFTEHGMKILDIGKMETLQQAESWVKENIL